MDPFEIHLDTFMDTKVPLRRYITRPSRDRSISGTIFIFWDTRGNQEFKNTDQFRAPWIPASLFEKTNRFGGQGIPIQKYGPIRWSMDPWNQTQTYGLVSQFAAKWSCCDHLTICCDHFTVCCDQLTICCDRLTVCCDHFIVGDLSHGTLDWRTPWKIQSGPNPLLYQKWITGGDRRPNFEKKNYGPKSADLTADFDKIGFFQFLTYVANLRCTGRYFMIF